MKIAVLSDIHANFEALMATYDHLQKWKPDFVVVSGDIINRGPRPLECLEFILNKKKMNNWLVLRGNHEDYVISQSKSYAPSNSPSSQVHKASIWTYKKLNDIKSLQAMPFQQSIFDPGAREVRFLHASMGGLRDGIYPEITNDELETKLKLPKNRRLSNFPILFCVGHTHRPFVKMASDYQIINVGSIGLPFDGDQRSSYARLEFTKGIWSADIIRVNYDLEKAEKDFFISGYYDEAGPLVRLVLVELRTATSLLYNWSAKYQNLALKGEISMEKSVKEFLQTLNS